MTMKPGRSALRDGAPNGWCAMGDAEYPFITGVCSIWPMGPTGGQAEEPPWRAIEACRTSSIAGMLGLWRKGWLIPRPVCPRAEPCGIPGSAGRPDGNDGNGPDEPNEGRDVMEDREDREGVPKDFREWPTPNASLSSSESS